MQDRWLQPLCLTLYFIQTKQSQQPMKLEHTDFSAFTSQINHPYLNLAPNKKGYLYYKKATLNHFNPRSSLPSANVSALQCLRNHHTDTAKEAPQPSSIFLSPSFPPFHTEAPNLLSPLLPRRDPAPLMLLPVRRISHISRHQDADDDDVAYNNPHTSATFFFPSFLATPPFIRNHGSVTEWGSDGIAWMRYGKQC